MTTLCEYLKCGVKTKLSRYGNIKESATLTQRLHDHKNHRRTLRHTVMLQKRDITNLSFINTPAPSAKKGKDYKKETKQDLETNKRLEMLQKWKEEKEKRIKEQKAKSKPLFKVFHVASNKTDDLEKIYREIKGKSIKAVSAEQFKLVPSSTYKFKPPANIKPINMTTKSTNNPSTRTRRQLQFQEELKSAGSSVSASSHEPTSRQTDRQLRSQTRLKSIISSKEEVSVNNELSEKKTRSAKNRRMEYKNKNAIINCPVTKMSEETSANLIPSNGLPHKFEVTPTVTQSKRRTRSRSVCSDNDFQKATNISVGSLPSADHPTSLSTSRSSITPKNKQTATYISPFVTVSRGKDNARKEFQRRRSEPDADLVTATYFRKLLTDNTEHFRALCNQWNSYKQENPAEEICDMINVAIGQTDLLLSKKFKHFSELVNNYVEKNSEKPITAVDLHGFWDTVLIQIKNVNKRFENLESLRKNNWEEILPLSTKPKKRTKAKNAAVKPKTATASSGLQAAIREARKRKTNKEQTTRVDEDIIVVTSVRKTPRRSSRKSITQLESTRKISSPGLIIMKVTHSAKSPNKLRTPIHLDKEVTNSQPKSILKSGTTKSALRKSKIVLFQKNEPVNQDNLENNLNAPNLISFSPDVTLVGTPRQSARLRAKLKDHQK